jgi:hypothetical protein
MRFSIRDILWLIAVSAMAALIWRERLSLKKEREFLHGEVAAQKESLKADLVKLTKAQGDVRRILQIVYRPGVNPIQLRAELQNVLDETRQPPLSDLELNRIKRDSAALGAPQPAPLPPGFGERPN